MLIGYSQDFVAQDKCKTVAAEPDRPGRAGALPGRGRLRPRHAEGGRRGRQVWGIGVDVDQYNAGQARPDERREARRQRRLRRRSQQEKAGKFAGGTDLLFNLKNGGVGVGKINPAVPTAFITLMNAYKAKIIAGTLKLPSSL